MDAHPKSEMQQSSTPRLDVESRATLLRIAFMLVVVGLWLIYSGDVLLRGGLVPAMEIAGTLTAVHAAVLREPLAGSSFNRWDESLVYIAVCLLAAGIA